MSYRRDRRIREAYEERFSEREVSFQRAVNVVERKTTVTRPELEYGRVFEHVEQTTHQYHGTRSYQNTREFQGEDIYPRSDREYQNESSYMSGFHRNSSPPLKDDAYSYYKTNGADQLRRQVEICSRAGCHRSSRGQRSSPPLRTVSAPFPDRGKKRMPLYVGHGEVDDYRRRDPYTIVRECSPVMTEPQPLLSVCSGSSTSSQCYSPDRDKGFSYQQIQQRRYEEAYSDSTELDKTKLLFTTNESVNESLPSTAKEELSTLQVKLDEVAAANKELSVTLEEDLKARRSQAIATKAMEIEKLYRQDCETFGTVVKMLASKEPSLDQLLQAPLKENLIELKQRCLNDLKHFIKELDHVVQPTSQALALKHLD